MTARILVVDDILPNVKLLEAKLSREYFEVITALNGEEALEKAIAESPDIILLDVMMPGIDGFEVCKLLKENPVTTHIPVVMVTALTDPQDRVKGLECGADDFLSKPVDDIALFSRVRSLVRLKMTIDEWIARENTANELGLIEDKPTLVSESPKGAKIMVIEDKTFEIEKITEVVSTDNDEVVSFAIGEEAIEYAKNNNLDVIIVSLGIENEDGLRLCSQLRSNDKSRSVPVLIVGEDTDMRLIAKALEIGAHDYVLRPVDKNELLARVRTQVRRKRYQSRLREDYEQSLSLALKDTLTGLYNRRYLMTHLGKLIEKNIETKKSICVMMLDIDHFKGINDKYGHDIGDEVLKIFSNRIQNCIRSFDLAIRLGGEEFFVVLPDVNANIAVQVAERLRSDICSEPFKVNTESGELETSVSIGAALLSSDEAVSVEEALKIADDELYRAKESGRNRVYFRGMSCVTLTADDGFE